MDANMMPRLTLELQGMRVAIQNHVNEYTEELNKLIGPLVDQVIEGYDVRPIVCSVIREIVKNRVEMALRERSNRKKLDVLVVKAVKLVLKDLQ